MASKNLPFSFDSFAEIKEALQLSQKEDNEEAKTEHPFEVQNRQQSI